MKYLFLVIFNLFIFGCATKSMLPIVPDVVVSHSVETRSVLEYPKFPQCLTPNQPKAIPWKWELPLDTSKRIPKRGKCSKVLEEDRDSKYWDRCEDHPLINYTNVKIGLTQEGFEDLMKNFNLLKAYVGKLTESLNSCNSLIEDWNSKAPDTTPN